MASAFAFACTTSACRGNLISFSADMPLSFLSMAASGIDTTADLQQFRRPARTSGRRSSRRTSREIAAADRYWRASAGELSKSGSARPLTSAPYAAGCSLSSRLPITRPLPTEVFKPKFNLACLDRKRGETAAAERVTFRGAALHVRGRQRGRRAQSGKRTNIAPSYAASA